MNSSNKNNFSNEHLQYLKKIKTKKAVILTLQISLIFIIFALWELFSFVGIFDSFTMSSPSRIYATIVEMYANNDFWVHVLTTLFEALAGFVIATILGTLTAIWLWYMDNVRKVLDPYIVVLNSLPKIALGPIIIIWFGVGFTSIIVMTVLIAVIITVLTMLQSFLECDKGKMLLLKSMGASKKQTLMKLVLPHSMPALVSVLKINVGMSWVGAIMGELLASNAGLGYLINYGKQVFNHDLVMASTLILCALAGFMYFLVALTEFILVRWK